MKVVHLRKNDPPVDLDESAKKWEKVIREHPTNAGAYDELMKIYRKQKDLKKELRTLNTAIRVFNQTFRKKQPVFDRKVVLISKKLLKATGLADKKGENIYQLGELARWKKRKTLVEKRLKKG